MSDVVSLEEVRAKRRRVPVPTFDSIMERLFSALDLMEARRTDEAHKAVCDGIEMLLAREARVIVWTKK